MKYIFSSGDDGPLRRTSGVVNYTIVWSSRFVIQITSLSINLKNLQLQRGFAQERRPTSNDDETLKDSAGGASQQAQQVKTTPQEIDTDSDSGEIPTPSLLKATSTKDFFISSRDQRLRQKERVHFSPFPSSIFSRIT